MAWLRVFNTGREPRTEQVGPLFCEVKQVGYNTLISLHVSELLISLSLSVDEMEKFFDTVGRISMDQDELRVQLAILKKLTHHYASREEKEIVVGLLTMLENMCEEIDRGRNHAGTKEAAKEEGQGASKLPSP